MHKDQSLNCKLVKSEEMDYLRKSIGENESSLCASRGFRFCLCSTCGCCCWGCRRSDFYGLLYGRNLWRLSSMCRTSSTLQHVSTIRPDQGQAHYCFSRQASYGEGLGCLVGPVEFLLELDAGESSSRIYGEFQSQDITVVNLRCLWWEKNGLSKRK